MKKFVKTYVGKGKSTPMGIIKVHLLVSELMKFAHQFNDQDYVNIEIARLKSPDNFGRDYTVYVNSLVETSEEVPQLTSTEPVESAEPQPALVEEPKASNRSKKSHKKVTDEIPF